MTDTARKWWPLDWADEVRATPDEFIIDADGHYYLGYAFDTTDATAQEKRYYSKSIDAGEIVEFIHCDPLPAVEIEISKDGSHKIVGGPVDPRANSFWDGSDPDTLTGSLEEFARNLAELGDEADGAWPRRLTVRTAYWSDGIPHKLAIYNEKLEVKPRFEQCSKAEARQ